MPANPTGHCSKPSPRPKTRSAAKQAIGKQISHWHLNRRSATDLAGLAGAINARIRGWFNYYGAFYRSELYAIAARIDEHLVRWDAEVQTIARTHQSGDGTLPDSANHNLPTGTSSAGAVRGDFGDAGPHSGLAGVSERCGGAPAGQRVACANPPKHGDGSTLPDSANHNSSPTGTSSPQPNAREPYDGRLSRTVLREREGEVPSRHSPGSDPA